MTSAFRGPVPFARRGSPMNPRHSRRLWLVALAAALTAWCAVPVRAVPITFAFRGTVTDVFVAPNVPGVPAADWPAPGTTFEGTYTFESTAPDTASNSFVGAYDTSSGGDFHAAAGGFRWYSPSSRIETSDSGIAGAEELYSATDGSSPGMQLVSHPALAAFFDEWEIRVTLRGLGAMLNGPGLPLTPPSLQAATAVRDFWLYGDHAADPALGPVVTIHGTLESLTLVPEPAACTALCAAFAWTLSRRRPRAS
jgi:hypothetical protein